MGAGWFGGQGAGWFDPTGAGWVGSGRGGGRGRFAMRTDRPLADFAVSALNVGAAFTPKRWDPDFFSMAIVPQFLAMTDSEGAPRWESIKNALPHFAANDSAATATEIDELRILAVTQRPEALEEIVEQDQGFQVLMLHLLSIDSVSHPNTFMLMKLAARVGELMMVMLKQHFNRARPSQLCPTLYPPVTVPGHSAYPAGHALISRLTALCLKEQGLTPAVNHAALDELARRIADNRCIAGLHFASDNAAGVQAADLILPILQSCPLYVATLAEAKKEWL
jgi:acid phosphatase (class A)